MNKKIEKRHKPVSNHRFCPQCEEKTKIVKEKILIPVGVEAFTTEALVCKKCGLYALTSEIRREMDEWGCKLTRNIVEPQPVFAESVHQFGEEIATQYGLKRVPFFRVLTAFYLSRIASRKDFQELKDYCEKHPSRKLLDEGTRSKVSVPIRYLMYRRLQTFSEVWNIPHAKTIEEAVLFGLTVLSNRDKNLEKLRAITESLQQYIVDVAQAA
jgi:hypothetical protein